MAVTLVLLLACQAQVTASDGTSTVAVAQSIVHDGDLSVPRELGVEGDGGADYSKYGSCCCSRPPRPRAASPKTAAL